MSCYHPFFMIPRIELQDVYTGEAKVKYDFAGHYVPEKHDLYPDGIRVPCGKCLGCKLDYSRRWADRMVLELESYRPTKNYTDAIFVTLTYNNNYVPYAYDPADPDQPTSLSLKKSDLQKFFKRLRKDFKHIRYYACGEYGKNTFRPHYHAIIFGLSLDDFDDRSVVGINELKQEYFTAPSFSRYWSVYDRKKNFYDPMGFVCISPVSYRTCAYVSRYCAKKQYGSRSAPSFYAEDEFSVMSRDPGIGSTYLKNYPDCLDFNNLYLNDGDASVKVAIPKYFLMKLKASDPDRYEKMMEERRKYAFDAEFLKLQKTGLSYIEALEVEENKLLNKTQILFNRKEV